MSFKYSAAACSLILILMSCVQPKGYGEELNFQLISDKANLPIWVRGNSESSTVVVFLHGGPGRSSLPYRDLAPGHEILRKTYRVVYWDQRFSGASSGNPDLSTMTLEQMTLDTVRVISIVQQELNPQKIILMGKSWGGAIGTKLCSDPAWSALIDGWIEVDGAHNLDRGISLSIEWVKNQAADFIKKGENIEYWQDALLWYEEYHERNFDFILTHGGYVNSANGIYLDPETDPGEGTNLFSPISPLAILNAANVAKNMDYYYLNLTDELRRIRIPTLILWGHHDGTLPVELAYEAFELIPSDQKKLHIFEHSAHDVSFAQPEDFAKQVISFIEEI